MKLYLVSDGDRRVWVAAETGEDMDTYVSNTGKFHLNDALGDEFFMGERRLSYRPIGVTEARQLIGEGLGTLGEGLERLLSEFRADPSPLDVDTVLSAAFTDTDGA